MNAARLIWIQTAPEPADAYLTPCGLFDFEIHATYGRGYQLRMWQTRCDASPRLVGEQDGFSLAGAEGWADEGRQRQSASPLAKRRRQSRASKGRFNARRLSLATR
jgi:hypothetical protein